jgi:hypothetical protein
VNQIVVLEPRLPFHAGWHAADCARQSAAAGGTRLGELLTFTEFDRTQASYSTCRIGDSNPI